MPDNLRCFLVRLDDPQVDFQIQIPGQALAQLEGLLARTPHVSSARHLGLVGKSESLFINKWFR